MANAVRGRSFYFFDIDDNLLFLPTSIYLWNAETGKEQPVNSGEYANVAPMLGKSGKWQAWSDTRDEVFRDFRDDPKATVNKQPFLKDLRKALGTSQWKGPSWPLLVHAAKEGRAIAMVTARGHKPSTIEAGLKLLVKEGHLPAVPPILGIYTVSNPDVKKLLGVTDPAMTTASVKKLAIKHAVQTALDKHGADEPHRFGMSDDDPRNVVLAISAMRDCKLDHPKMRFFVINTNHDEFVKLEIFAMDDPVTAKRKGRHLLADTPEYGGAAGQSPQSPTVGGNASVYITNMDRAIAFYRDKLGFKLRDRVGSDWAEIDAGKGLVIGLHPARPPDTVASGTRRAINIELAAARALDKVVAALKAKGVKFKGRIRSYPAVRLITALDPDGNELIIAQSLVNPS